MLMTKKEAIKLLGGKQRHVAQALEITESAVSQWPEELSQATADRVLGAAIRLGLVAQDGAPHMQKAAA
jgi:hypothetical protein